MIGFDVINIKQRFFLCCLLSFLFLMGCSTMEVNNNKFISSRFPYLEAKVSPEFKYLAHFEYEDQTLSVDKKRSLRCKYNSFFFIPNAIIKGLIPKYIYIRIAEVETYFIPDLLTGDSYIDRDLLKLGWYNFQIVSQIAFPKATVDKQLEKLVEDGYMMPECVLRRIAIRRVGHDKKTIGIYYGEDATLSGYACERWKDQANLTDEQKKYITEFNKRALTTFEIIASD
jgi:hypothetical protein